MFPTYFLQAQKKKEEKGEILEFFLSPRVWRIYEENASIEGEISEFF